MDTYEEIQDRYIAALRKVQPGLIAWWKEVAGLDNLNDSVRPEIANRWPTGYSGHPRVMAIFREHFFAIDDLNRQHLEALEDRPDRPRKELWFDDAEDDEVAFRRPVDLLILGIEDKAPDIHKLVAGIVYVPVGLDQYDEAV